MLPGMLVAVLALAVFWFSHVLLETDLRRRSEQDLQQIGTLLARALSRIIDQRAQELELLAW